MWLKAVIFIACMSKVTFVSSTPAYESAPNASALNDTIVPALPHEDDIFVSKTPPVVRKGPNFYNSATGEYFGIRGVNYYPRPNTGELDDNNFDFFTADFHHIWGRDIPHFEALNVNTIRLYAVNPGVDHSEFMCELQRRGIYVIVDLAARCEGCEITDEKFPACYPSIYKTRGELIISEFSAYDNVIAFSGGNEVNHRTGGNPPEWNAPCQKKFIRDMRAFMSSCPGMRQVPMGLVVADSHREENAKYYSCRTNEADEFENAEWYGINAFLHCDANRMEPSTAFQRLLADFQNLKYPIPTILTEFGCLNSAFPEVDGYEAQRTFEQAAYINAPPFMEYFGGGIAFEYSTENANVKNESAYPFTIYGSQNYGLGYLTPEDCNDMDKKCSYARMPNFQFLAEKYEAANVRTELTMDEYEIPSDRQNLTECPESFAKLSDTAWASDAFGSIECPSVTKFMCSSTSRFGSASSASHSIASSFFDTSAPSRGSSVVIELPPIVDPNTIPASEEERDPTAPISVTGSDEDTEDTKGNGVEATGTWSRLWLAILILFIA